MSLFKYFLDIPMQSLFWHLPDTPIVMYFWVLRPPLTYCDFVHLRFFDHPSHTTLIDCLNTDIPLTFSSHCFETSNDLPFHCFYLLAWDYLWNTCYCVFGVLKPPLTYLPGHIPVGLLPELKPLLTHLLLTFIWGFETSPDLPCLVVASVWSCCCLTSAYGPACFPCLWHQTGSWQSLLLSHPQEHP